GQCIDELARIGALVVERHPVAVGILLADAPHAFADVGPAGLDRYGNGFAAVGHWRCPMCSTVKRERTWAKLASLLGAPPASGGALDPGINRKRREVDGFAERRLGQQPTAVRPHRQPAGAQTTADEEVV